MLLANTRPSIRNSGTQLPKPACFLFLVRSKFANLLSKTRCMRFTKILGNSAGWRMLDRQLRKLY
jgi:hypothetical protein